jgi:hypothetical protein
MVLDDLRRSLRRRRYARGGDPICEECFTRLRHSWPWMAPSEVAARCETATATLDDGTYLCDNCLHDLSSRGEI